DDGELIHFWVRDHGHGIPPGQEELIFDRFATARGQLRDRRAGTGLGLAIVSTIAAAHGGTAGAANAPDGGAYFSITIPLIRPRRA
ncbi:ATP-binding protein, partial [Dietzia sp.]|uniref:ATP-binding protein n=1 Tax=Dietzia sp. TaxID=1871616 RepID=UPI002FDB004C